MFQENLVVEDLSLLASFAMQHERRNLSFCVHNSTDELLMLVAKNFESFRRMVDVTNNL